MRLKARALILALLLPLAAAPSSAQKAPQPKMGGQSVPLVASDGWKITARYQPPQDNGKVLLFIHSAGKSKDEWAALAGRISRLGYGYLALDLRGHGESLYDAGGSSTSYRNFDKKGTTNEFNQMTRDIEAAIDYLAEQQIGEDRIILAGSGLGANLAVRAAAVCPSVPMMLLIGPTLNAARDVLTVNPLRAYGKRQVLIIVAQQPKRIYDESVLLKAVAQLAAGQENVTFISEYKGMGTELLNYNTIPRILQWLRTPAKPPEVEVSTYTVTGSTEPAVPGDIEALPEEIPVADDEDAKAANLLDTED
ncbi:MAG: alpha/beta hydrolase [Elusimicrobia bacterium]|nr:alpha/beta hydrolase [Elusimicrobiota bacterium]